MKQQWNIFVSMEWVINFELFQSHTKSRIKDSEALDFPIRRSQVGNHQLAEGVFPFIGSICRCFLHSHRHKVNPALAFSSRSGCRIALKKLCPVPLSFWCATSDLKWNTKCILQSFKIAVGELPPLILFLPSTYSVPPDLIILRMTLEKEEAGKIQKLHTSV